MIRHPEIRRVSYADHIHAATAGVRKVDADRAARMLGAVTQLQPLHAIQTALDALSRTAQSYRDGKPDEYGLPLSYHVKEAAGHVRYYRDVLKAGYDAAEAMIAEMDEQTASLETAMKTHNSGKDEHPELTTDGDPHPLEQGGYDADSDTQLPGNVSDVAALVEGKTTRAQAEAIGKADAANSDGQEPTDADGFPAGSGEDADDEGEAEEDLDADGKPTKKSSAPKRSHKKK